MRIYFIRHGHPNYEKDCLTDIGHLQAEACANRLKNKGIQRVFASTKGRAMETAAYTAKKLGLEVEPLDFIRELRWQSKTEQPIFKNGHPWSIVDDMTLKGEDLTDEDWSESARFSSSVIGASVKTVTDGIDSWLRDFGYEREGKYYRVVGNDTKQIVAIFSHAGASTAALSHLLSVAFPWFIQVIRLDFTSVTIVDLGDEVGTLTFPRLTLLNDARHIEEIDSNIFFGN
jgi:probable phosphoglycerate mutase